MEKALGIAERNLVLLPDKYSFLPLTNHIPTFKQLLIQIKSKHPELQNHLKEAQTILSAINKIETALLDDDVASISAVNKIITDELQNIQSATRDTSIYDLLFTIRYNWQIYSGHRQSKTFKAGNIIVKEYMLDDCNELKNYIQKYL